MDWNLIACARSHLTYAADEPELRAHLHVESASGEAWRCLRCGDFVLGPPHGHGPADEAPVPLRGQLLRDAVVLRLLALDRLVRGLIFLLAAYGAWRVRANRATVLDAFNQNLPLVQPLADRLGWRLEDSSLVHLIRSFLNARPQTLAWVVAGLVAYAGIQLTEAVGLWLLKRWGEYLSAVATSVFIPFEIYEIIEKVTWVRIGALILNIAAVVFLVYRKHLFGAHGGRAAYDEERHEQSLLQVLRSAAA